MNLDLANRKVTALIFGSACLSAAAFWLLAAGSALWLSNAGLFSAIVPQGGEFLLRVLYASIFAIAGAFAGAIVQRGRDIEEFAIDKLTESERKYQALLASSFDSVLTLNRHAQVVEMSDSAAALFGNSARAMIGTAIDDFVEVEAGMNPHLGRQFSDMLPAAAADSENAIVVRGRAQHGRRFPAEIRVTSMPAGGTSHYLLSVRETTSSVVAQKALRHSERRYQALFDHIPDGVYRSLPGGKLLAANPALVRMLGYDSTEQLIEQGNARNFYCDQQQRVALVSRLEKSGEARNVEINLRRRDGSTLLALANIRAIVSDSNEGIVYEGTLTDITDLQAARDALQDSEEHFRALCEHSLDVINVINTDGEIVYSSPSSVQLTQRTPEEQRGLTLFRSVHPEDAPVVAKMIEDGFARPGTPKHFTCRLYRDDGSLRFVDAVGTAFLTRRGELRAVINSRDVTEQVETEARLRELQQFQVVGFVTKNFTDEFNEVLTALSANLAELARCNADPEMKPGIDAAIAACQRGTDLTRRMMAFSPRADVRPQRVDANDLLRNLAPALQRSLHNSLPVETDFADDLWPVRVDRAQLEGAILQLAVNAREAIGAGAVLTLTTRNQPHGVAGNGLPDAAGDVDYISVSVKNNGKGMSNEALARATNSLVDGSEKTALDDLGLGAVRQFVASAGGELRVSSQVDAGTEVTLFLPRTKRGTACCPGEYEQDACCSEHVLVVDQDAEARQATAAMLASVGYQVSQADGGEAAMQILEASNIDLLFADLGLAPLSGGVLAERVSSSYPTTKILLMSGSDAAAAGAFDSLNAPYELIRKPFGRKRLAEQVRLVLET